MGYIDLQGALGDWPYEPDKISVRKILGTDGDVRIQIRVELGILQLEGSGRPDGIKPHGGETLLAYHKARLAAHEQVNGTPLGFSLSREECGELRFEASLFYRRYVAYFVLEEYVHVGEDTAHSLAILDLCSEHAIEADDRVALESFRPYLLMMDARGRAHQALEEGKPSSAIAHINRGIMQIRAFYDDHGQPGAEDSSEEVRILKELLVEVDAQVPQDSILVTRKALREAVEQERFEEAARLRDALKNRFDQRA